MDSSVSPESASVPHRIDTHIHIITPSYAEALTTFGGDPSGWSLPSWTTADTIQAMNTLRIQTGVMSVTAPGTAIAGSGVEGRTLTRKVNEECLEIVRSKEAAGRIKLFANMTNWVDVEGTLAEIDWASKEGMDDVLGFVAMTSYEDRLLGDPIFQPIWDKLDALKAVVFIHPAAVNIKPNQIASWLPQPFVDYPQQTTRCAVDLVLRGTVTAHPHVKVILSHAGGTLPFIAQRVLTLLRVGFTEMMKQNAVTYEQATEAMSTFYFDVALSTSNISLQSLLEFTTPDKILYGSDYPYAPLPGSIFMTDQLDKFLSDNHDAGKKLAGVNRENAEKLFGPGVKW